MSAGISVGAELNNRRKLVIALGAGAIMTPVASLAQQQGKVWHVGFIGPTSASDGTRRLDALRAALRELGYIEGKNLTTELRSSEGKYERLPDLAAELVRLKVDVIITTSTPATRAAQKATATIPIVMAGVGDPVGGGFVKTLARPGGNVTGFANMGEDLGPKQLEMLLSMAPKVTRAAVLINPSNTSHIKILERTQAAGQKRGIAILAFNARTPQEIDTAFLRMVREKAGGVMVVTEPFFSQEIRHIAAMAAKTHIPSIYGGDAYADEGGLMSYTTSRVELNSRVAACVDKILKGAKPADLPVEQPTKFELVINGKSAKTLGLKIPQSLLVMADKVIE
jgi:putative ABC transport system substrate-binding protein